MSSNSFISDRSSLIRLIDSLSSGGISSREIPGSSIYTSQDHTSPQLIKRASNYDVSLTYPSTAINYEPIPNTSFNISTSDPSWVMSNTNSSFLKPPQPYTSYHQKQSSLDLESMTTGIAPHAANVPGLIRRGSSRRRVVVNRAPSIRSEKKRVSTISEFEDLHTTNSSKSKQKKYGYYVPKKKVFTFMPFIKRKDSVKVRYRHKSHLAQLFESTSDLQLQEIYIKNKTEPLILQQYSLETREKFKDHPRLRGKLQMASIDLKNQLCFEDPTADILDLYYRDYPVPNPTLNTLPITPYKQSTDTSDKSQATLPSATTTEREYRHFKKQFFNSKYLHSKQLFEGFEQQVPEEHIKRLALTIYLRRLMAAKIALRVNLENSTTISSKSITTVLTEKLFHDSRGEEEFHFVSNRNTNSGSMVYLPPGSHHIYDLDSDSLNSSKQGSKFDSLIDLSFPSSAGSRLTFHSFK